jgi:hypothetical protein
LNLKSEGRPRYRGKQRTLRRVELSFAKHGAASELGRIPGGGCCGQAFVLTLTFVCVHAQMGVEARFAESAWQ